MSAAYDVLKFARIKRIVKAIQDQRVLKPELKFLRRTPIVPASDGELMARFVGRTQIADLISDDSPANVYTTGKLNFEGVVSPNIKHGVSMNQTQINELAQLSEEDIMDEDGVFRQYQRNTIMGLMDGIDHRREAIIIAGHIDDFDYNRFGIVISDGSFGMPPDLKITPAPGWANVNSPIVDDILRLKRIGRTRYGIEFDRMTLCSQAFQYVLANTQFQTYVKQMGGLSVNMPVADQVIPVDSMRRMKRLALEILELNDIEIYDSRYWSQNEAGLWTSTPLLPLNKVIFTATTNDNNPAVMDFSNGVVTESIVSTILGQSGQGIIGGMSSPQRGPVSYVTPANINLNPPGLVWWGVAKGWFRRHLQQLSAVFDIGAVTDDIPVSEISLS